MLSMFYTKNELFTIFFFFGDNIHFSLSFFLFMHMNYVDSKFCIIVTENQMVAMLVYITSRMFHFKNIYDIE